MIKWNNLKGSEILFRYIKRFAQWLQIQNIYSDGQSRAGVYCAANACIEQVIQHGEVDVFQAVKTVRRHRPQVVENIVSIKILIFDFVNSFYIICKYLDW